METRINHLKQNQPLVKTQERLNEFKKKEIEYTPNTDVFVRSDAPKKDQSMIYTSKPSLDELRVIEERRLTAFREMIVSMLAKQGEAHNLELFGKKFNVSIEDSEKAAASIAEGGEYSVDAVATRILDMAHSLANGDPSKISLLRGAVEKGFGEAAKAFGKEMPGITQDTYKEVMKRFNEWENESK